MEKSDEESRDEESAMLKLISNPLPTVISLGMKNVKFVKKILSKL